MTEIRAAERETHVGCCTYFTHVGCVHILYSAVYTLQYSLCASAQLTRASGENEVRLLQGCSQSSKAKYKLLEIYKKLIKVKVN